MPRLLHLLPCTVLLACTGCFSQEQQALRWTPGGRMSMSDPDAAQHRPPSDVFTTPTAAQWTRYFPNLPRLAQNAGAQVSQASVEFRERWNSRHATTAHRSQSAETDHTAPDAADLESDGPSDVDVSGAISPGGPRDVPVLPVALVAEVAPQPEPAVESSAAPVRLTDGYDPGAIKERSERDSQTQRAQADAEQIADQPQARPAAEVAQRRRTVSPFAAIENAAATAPAAPPLAEAVESSAPRNDPFAEVRSAAPAAEAVADMPPADNAEPLAHPADRLVLPDGLEAPQPKSETSGESKAVAAATPIEPVRSYRRTPRPITSPTSEKLAGRPQANLVRPWVDDTSAKLPPAEFPVAYYGPDSVPPPDGPNQPGADKRHRLSLPKLGIIQRMKERRENRILARSGNAPQPGDVPQGR